jgi:hypothetical protein
MKTNRRYNKKKRRTIKKKGGTKKDRDAKAREKELEKARKDSIAAKIKKEQDRNARHLEMLHRVEAAREHQIARLQKISKEDKDRARAIQVRELYVNRAIDPKSKAPAVAYPEPVPEVRHIRGFNINNYLSEINYNIGRRHTNKTVLTQEIIFRIAVHIDDLSDENVDLLLIDNAQKYNTDVIRHISKPRDGEHPLDFFIRLSTENHQLYKGVSGIKSIFSNIRNYLSVFYLLLLAKIAVDQANNNKLRMDIKDVLIINVTYIVIKIVICQKMPMDHEANIDRELSTGDSIINRLGQIIRSQRFGIETFNEIDEINNAANVLLRSTYLKYKELVIRHHKFYKFIPENLQQDYRPHEITESNLDKAFDRYKQEHKDEFHRDEVPIRLLEEQILSKLKRIPEDDDDDDERIYALDKAMCEYLTINYPDEGRIFCQYLKSSNYSIDDAKPRKRKVAEPMPVTALKPVPKPAPKPPSFADRFIGRRAEWYFGIKPQRENYGNDTDYNNAIAAYNKKK